MIFYFTILGWVKTLAFQAKYFIFSFFHKLFSEFAHLRQKYWYQHLWARGYFVATTGTVTD